MVYNKRTILISKVCIVFFSITWIYIGILFGIDKKLAFLTFMIISYMLLFVLHLLILRR